MKMLKSKHFRRLAVFLAMIAPAVYLFGSLFNTLNGAHGAFPLSAEYDVVVGNRELEFNQLAKPFALGDWFANSYPSTISFDGGVVSFGPRTDLSYTVGDVSSNIAFSSGDVIVYRFTAKKDNENGSFEFAIRGGDGDNNFNYTLNDSWLVYDSRVVISNSRSWVQFRDYDTCSVKDFNVFNLTRIYGQGNEPSLDDFYRDFPEPYYDYVLSQYIDVPVYGVPDNSEYLFNQFFARDNFLVQWGRNAISENPHGFAPFGAFWRYLDINVLHLSNDQVGLMGYGYLYYACHVLLFDVGFVLVTFFLDFIQRIADKFTGGE